jgi:hypothetical protein
MTINNSFDYSIYAMIGHCFFPFFKYFLLESFCFIGSSLLWKYIQKIAYDPIKESLFKSANDAYDLSFLAKGEVRPNLESIYDLTLLDQILSEKGLSTIEAAATTVEESGLVIDNTTTSSSLPDVVS